MILVGVACFAGFAVLLAFSGEPSRSDGGVHALSRSAVGFAGLVELLREAGGTVLVSRDPAGSGGPKAALLVLTPPPGAPGPATMPDLNADTVLIVLPKWRTAAVGGHAGWVRPTGLQASRDVLSALPKDWDKPRLVRRSGVARPVLTAARPFDDPPALRPIDRLQVLASAEWTPILRDAEGGIVLGQANEDGPYVLSDPDLLNDQALADLAGAKGAVHLVTTLAGGGTVAFDVSLNGLGRSRNPLRMIFEPPLLGATLCAAVAALLTGLLSARRFGPARPADRAFDLGKRALADNAAALITRARREPRMARPYADLTRHLAASAVAAPRRLGTAELDAYLDRAAAGRGAAVRWTVLLAESGAVRDGAGLVRFARRLHRWRMGLVHGPR